MGAAMRFNELIDAQCLELGLARGEAHLSVSCPPDYGGGGEAEGEGEHDPMGFGFGAH